MSVLKTLAIGTLMTIGGCTVVVGGCTIGATKATVKALNGMADVTGQSHFNKLYKENPARAEAKYQEVTTDCYLKTMRASLGDSVPQRIADERVKFDIYEIRIRQSGDENNIQHLDAWRRESDKKIIMSLSDKRQRSALKTYFKGVKKGNLLESMCVANALAPDKNTSSRTRRTTSRR